MKVTLWRTDATEHLRRAESREMRHKNTDTPTFRREKDDLGSYIANVYPTATAVIGA